MATSLTLENDSSLVAQGYIKVNGSTAATVTENGLSMSTLNSINVDDYTVLSDFIGANQSLSQNGYQRLPGGLIIQWGVISGPNASTTATVTFPIGFTDNYVAIPISNSSADLNLTILNYTTTTFQIRNASATNSANAFWIAIGY